MIVTLLVLAALLVLPLIHMRDSARETRRRGAWFGEVLGLFDSYRVTQDGKAWPVLTGRYKGRDIRLEPVLDDMTWRKLPSLWLKATLLSSNPGRGTLGFMVRAQGGEFYSPTGEMAHRLASPAQWPAAGLLCTDDVKTVPLSPGLDAQMVAFTDPRMKELVITPRGRAAWSIRRRRPAARNIWCCAGRISRKSSSTPPWRAPCWTGCSPSPRPWTRRFWRARMRHEAAQPLSGFWPWRWCCRAWAM